ncbi:MAG TPA: PAS domain S-box protein [Aquabacterium sp.]|nr:PAS domain S-box protein [Aquabacterium sp.]
MNSQRTLSQPIGIALALSLTLLAAVTDWLFRGQVPGLMWLLFYPAVYISSWRGGVYAGISSAVASVALLWLWLTPGSTNMPGGTIATGVFALMSGLICYGHERARRSEHRLRILFVKSADAIIVADLYGHVRTVNPAACLLLGQPRAKLLGQSMFDLAMPQDTERLRQALDVVRRGGVDRLEIRLAHALGNAIPVELSTNALAGDEWLINLRDIRPRKEAEESLLQIRAELYEAQRLGQIGSWQWDCDANVLTWSPELFRIYQYDPTLPPPSMSELEKRYVPSSRQARDEALQDVLTTGRPYSAERELCLPDGQRHWVSITTEGIRSPDGRIHKLRGTAQDITERKHIELQLLESRKELREMAAHRDREREEERKAIAREIHDELGQLLTAMRMDVSHLQKACGEQEGVQPILMDLRKLVERMFEVMRSLATSLRPSALDLGLLTALEWLVEDFSLRWELPCHLKVEGEERQLDDSLSTAVFRVVQESLTNVAKHAQARQVSVTLRFDTDAVAVQIHDDGQGFDPSRPIEAGHFGLLGMRERVLSLQGRIDVVSAPGRGTHIDFRVPTQTLASAS